jgi:hypothetical protein
VDRTGRRTLSEANLYPVWQNQGGAIRTINEAWGWHDFNGDFPMNCNAFCDDLVKNYGLTDRGVSDRLGAFQEFCTYAQMQNYDGYRAMFEAYNFKMSDAAPTSGVLLWMSNSSWPSNLWQTYDYYLDCNAAYFGARKACEPVHVQATFAISNQQYYVDVVNTTAQSLPDCKVSFQIWGADGKMYSSQDATVTAAANAKTYSGLMATVPEFAPGAFFLKTILQDADNQELSSNVYARGKANDWSALAVLRGMPKLDAGSEITGSFTHTTDGATITFKGTISNTTTDNIAHMVRLTLLKDGVSENGFARTYVDPRVLPTFYSDNYFTLMPGETRAVAMEIDEKSLDGYNPVLEMGGFNVNRGLIQLDVVPVASRMPVTGLQTVSVRYVPAQGIVVSGESAGGVSVHLFDLRGRQLYSGTLNRTTAIIRSHDLMKGVYVVRLSAETENSILVRRVMVR